MDEDDNIPRAPQAFEPRNLDSLSVEELGDYIAALEAEIARVKADRARKQDHRSGAEALFRK